MDSTFSGNGSPASSTSNNPSPVPYYRADSLVIEKPSHFNHEASESIEFYSVMNGDNSRVEVLVIDQSQPSCNSAPQSPGSGYNSSKTTDDEGDNEGELDEGFCDELGDEGFAQLLVPDNHNPSESDMIPTSVLLDDFDLGVDMFDSTEQAIPTSEPLKSPFNQLPMAPGSPYQFVAATSSCSSPLPIPQQDIQAQNDYNEYLNQVHSHSNASSGSPYSQHSGGYVADENDDLAMLLQVTGGIDVMTSSPEVLPLPIVTCCEHTTGCSTIGMDFSPHSVSYATSTFTSQTDPSFSTPTLTSVHMDQPNLMDLAEASELVLTGDGIHVNTGLINVGMDSGPMITPSSSTAPVELKSNNYSTMSSLNMSIPINTATNSVAGTQMCSRSSQTISNSNRMTRSLSPAPDPAQSPSSYLDSRHCHSPSPTPSVDQYSASPLSSVSTGACYYTPSPDSSHLMLSGSSSKDGFRSGSPLSRKSSGKTSPLPTSKDRLVDMPFYQFKKILDNPNIDTNDKEEAKNIRKRGKNKVAAKQCRQKKIEVVMGLQQEVDRMREQKKVLDTKCKSLEREINMFKQKCSSFRSLAYSST